MLTGKHSDSKVLGHAHTHAKMNATKSFQHRHMRMLIVGQLTTFLLTHSHAQMKAVQSYQQIHTLIKPKDGQMFPIHTLTHAHTYPRKIVDKEELFHIHAQANITAPKSFTIRTLMQK